METFWEYWIELFDLEYLFILFSLQKIFKIHRKDARYDNIEIKIIYTNESNKRFPLISPEGWWIWQSPDEDWRVQHLKFHDENENYKEMV